MSEIILIEANLTRDEISIDDQITQESIILSIVYGLILLFGIMANLIVVFVYIFKDGLNKSTNFFFISLSISDILVLIVCIPIIITELYSNEWLYGIIYCNLKFFLFLSLELIKNY